MAHPFWEKLAKKAAPESGVLKTTMPVIKPIIKKLPLPESQYYPAEQPKTHIFLHHTAGGSAASSIAHWASNPEHIATPYIIDRDGTIYECFDPKYWAYHLGVKGLTSLEKASIGIEICSYGALEFKGGDWLTYTGRHIEDSKMVKVPFRGAVWWEAYTPEQIAALKLLLPYLLDLFKIKPQTDRKDFWEYQNPAKLPPGIWSHTTVRKDKIDIFPQKELVELVYSL